MSVSVRIPLKITALAPISHNSDERAGNTAFFRTMAVALPGGDTATVPVISGNSLRGQLRRFAVRRMLADLGVPQSALPPPLYHFFFSGGSIAKGDTKAPLMITSINALRAELPIIGLFGGTWAGTILPGCLRVGWIWPICAETAHLTGEEGGPPAAGLLTTAMFTRRDDGEAQPADGEEDASTQMIFDVELFKAGVELRGFVGVERSTELEAAFLGAVLGDWLANPRLGGQAARGMGGVAVQEVALPSAEPYLAAVATRRGAMREALRGMGATVAEGS